MVLHGGWSTGFVCPQTALTSVQQSIFIASEECQWSC